jgi:hypothetical protein
MKRLPTSFAFDSRESEALNGGQELLGLGHSAFLVRGGSVTELSVTYAPAPIASTKSYRDQGRVSDQCRSPGRVS